MPIFEPRIACVCVLHATLAKHARSSSACCKYATERMLADSLLVAAPEVNARGLLRAAADEVTVGACLARLAVVTVPSDADDGTFFELLS